MIRSADCPGSAQRSNDSAVGCIGITIEQVIVAQRPRGDADRDATRGSWRAQPFEAFHHDHSAGITARTADLSLKVLTVATRAMRSAPRFAHISARRSRRRLQNRDQYRATDARRIEKTLKQQRSCSIGSTVVMPGTVGDERLSNAARVLTGTPLAGKAHDVGNDDEYGAKPWRLMTLSSVAQPIAYRGRHVAPPAANQPSSANCASAAAGCCSSR